MCFLNQVETAVIIAGDEGIVSTFDVESHELIDTWNVGTRVSALAALSVDEGGFIIAVGTVSGSVIIRQDWEEFVPRHHECGRNHPIVDLKFSKNKSILAAASTDGHIYLL